MTSMKLYQMTTVVNIAHMNFIGQTEKQNDHVLLCCVTKATGT